MPKVEDGRFPDPHDDGLRNQVANSLEIQAYLTRLFSHLPDLSERSRLIPEGSPGSVEQHARMGKFWWQAREANNLTRKEVAKRLADTSMPHEIITWTNTLRLFEFGLGEAAEYRGSFPESLAEVLGDRKLYPAYCRKFDIPYVEPTEVMPDTSIFTAASNASYGSDRWKANIAAFFAGQRERSGLSIDEVARRMKYYGDEVPMLESGQLTVVDLQGDLPRRYAWAINDPGVYASFNWMFHREYGVVLPATASSNR